MVGICHNMLMVVKSIIWEVTILIYALIVLGSFYIVMQVLGINKKFLIESFRCENANELIKFLIETGAPVGTAGKPPRYKFYSHLVEELISARNRFGAEIRSALRDIRKALILDIREEKKIKDAVLGGYFQYLFMSAFIWAFLYMATEMISLERGLEGTYVVVGWQITGGALLVFSIHFYRRQVFSPFAYYFESIYQMRVLLKSKRPLSEVVTCFDPQRVLSSRELGPFSERLQLLCASIKLTGRVDLSEFDHLLSELWDHFEIQFLRFMKILNLFKMISVLVFILPSFFICIALIFGQIAVFE